ncbi:hypothetical protein ACFE04_024235 [Oxalis oulophora]
MLFLTKKLEAEYIDYQANQSYRRKIKDDGVESDCTLVNIAEMERKFEESRRKGTPDYNSSKQKNNMVTEKICHSNVRIDGKLIIVAKRRIVANGSTSTKKGLFQETLRQ